MPPKRKTRTSTAAAAEPTAPEQPAAAASVAATKTSLKRSAPPATAAVTEPPSTGRSLCVVCKRAELDPATGFCDHCGGYTVCTKCYQDGPCTRSGLCADCLDKVQTTAAAKPTPVSANGHHPTAGGKLPRKNPSTAAVYQPGKPMDQDLPVRKNARKKRRHAHRRRASSSEDSDSSDDRGPKKEHTIPSVTVIDPGQPNGLDRFELPRTVHCHSCHCQRHVTEFFGIKHNAAGAMTDVRMYLTCQRDRSRRRMRDAKLREERRGAESNNEQSVVDSSDEDDDDDGQSTAA